MPKEEENKYIFILHNKCVSEQTTRIRTHVMCVDLLDPCKICRVTCYLVVAMILIFIGGYVGKAIYLHTDEDDETVPWHDVFLDGSFWVPDGYFWVFGIAFIVLLFVAAAILRGIGILLSRALEYLCCHLCCSIERTDLENGSKKERKDRYEAVEADEKSS